MYVVRIIVFKEKCKNNIWHTWLSITCDTLDFLRKLAASIAPIAPLLIGSICKINYQVFCGKSKKILKHYLMF